jgi:cell division protein FtsB
MQWLLYLLCPLMMLVCMIGLFKGGNKESNKKTNISTSQDLDNLNKQMAKLLNQNKQLTEEVKNLQSANTSIVRHDQTKHSSNIS